MKKRRFFSLALAMMLALSLCYTACGERYSASDSEIGGIVDGELNGSAEMDTPASDGAGSNHVLEDPAENPNRKIVKEYQITFKTQDFEAFTAKVRALTEDAGGYFENVTTDTSGYSEDAGRDLRTSKMTLRIPQEKADKVCESLKALGTVTYYSENAEDISLKYSDVQARCNALRDQQKRLEALIAQAENVQDMIQLQERLFEISYQLESYESQLRTYDSSVKYSTINLTVREAASIKTTTESVGTRIQQGVNHSLQNISAGFVNFFVVFVTISPYLVLALLLTGIVLAIVLPIVKRSKKQKPVPLPPQKPAQPQNPPRMIPPMAPQEKPAEPESETPSDEE